MYGIEDIESGEDMLLVYSIALPRTYSQRSKLECCKSLQKYWYDLKRCFEDKSKNKVL